MLNEQQSNTAWHVYLRVLVRRVKEVVVASWVERFTIMFVPHSERHVFNFQIPRVFIFLFVCVIVVVTVGGIYFYFAGTKAQNDLEKTNDKLFLANDNLEQYAHLVPNIKDKFEHLHGHLNMLKTIVGALSWDTNSQNYVGGEEVSDSEYSNVDEKVRQIQELKHLYYKIGLMAHDLKGLSELFKGYKSIFNGMPSIFPLLGTNLGVGYITSYFGWRRDPFINKMRMHNGVDIINIPGTPVVATASGVVVQSGHNDGRGVFVTLKHKFGFTTEYMHMSKSVVEVGYRVTKGQVLGYLGDTGRSTGPHLHYEIRINGVPIDPMSFISLDKAHHFRVDQPVVENRSMVH